MNSKEFPREEKINNSATCLRTIYKKGTRIIVDCMDDPCPAAPGTEGDVDFVDDSGTIHCKFNNGRYLGLIPEPDVFRTIS